MKAQVSAILETFVEGGGQKRKLKRKSLFMCSFCKASCKLNKAVIYNVSVFLIYFFFFQLGTQMSLSFGKCTVPVCVYC